MNTSTENTILITGSNGMLGQKIICALLDSSVTYNIIATSNGENRLKRKGNYIYESLDISDKNSVVKCIDKYRPFAVINTAAITNVDACELNKDVCKKVNIEGVENLIYALEKNSSDSFIPHFLHLSTDFVFDGNNGPYAEEDKPNPLSYYAYSKFESEKLVMNSKLNWSILRTIIVYGVADNMTRSNLVLWAKDALERKQKINVINDQFRAPTLAEDLADACIASVQNKAYGIFHVSGEETLSIIDLVYEVADYFNLDKSYIQSTTSEELKQPAKRPPRTGFILDKAKKFLNYKPHTFHEGLKLIEKQLKDK